MGQDADGVTRAVFGGLPPCAPLSTCGNRGTVPQCLQVKFCPTGAGNSAIHHQCPNRVVSGEVAVFGDAKSYLSWGAWQEAVKGSKVSYGTEQ